MGVLNAWKHKAANAHLPQSNALRKDVKSQLQNAAGADYFMHRDPVWHVSEDFQRIFEDIGRQKGKEADYAFGSTSMVEQTDARKTGEKQNGESAEKNAPSTDLAHRRTDMSSMVEPSGMVENNMFLQKFSQMAFNRGTMSGAILGGTGKMMLFSCLKRTVGQTGPDNLRQRKLFEGSSQRRNVEGKDPDKVMFNRGETDGAVGLVVDVLRDARRTVDSITQLMSGKNALPSSSGASTLSQMYPFLSTDKEINLIESYKSQLSGATNVQDKEILKHAMEKTRALMEKKQQMKERFIVALREVSDRANDALEEFTAEGFMEEANEAVKVDVADDDTPPEEKSSLPEENEEM